MENGENKYFFTDKIIFLENPLHDITYVNPIVYELAAPKVNATFPGSSEQINHLGLNKIIVTFNQFIKRGDQFYAIRLFSDHDVKSAISIITGTELVIYSSTPLDPPANQLGGENWTVIIPSNAIVNMSGKPMEKEYIWVFSTIGVN